MRATRSTSGGQIARSTVRWPMQALAFARKEIADVARQPRTLLVMVLGPFAVLGLFGIGYDDAPPPMRTAFVVDESSPFRDEVERYVDELDLIEIGGVYGDPADAQRLLSAGDVDIVVEFPRDPVADLARGERSTMTVTHTRLDPIEQTGITFASQFAVDEINAAILAQLLDAGRDRILGLSDPETAAVVVDAASDAFDAPFAETIVAADTEVFVRPLDRSVQLAVDDVDSVTDWYAPAAVVLMLQQFGVAFGALSFVRERRLGINEVFRIAPVGGASSVAGKYVAFLSIGGVVAALLTALVVATLGVPIAGGFGDIVLVVALTLYASIGLGLVLSLVSTSETQAIQYTMLVLLASLFFSGFFLSLDQLAGVSTFVARLLPASYAMELLRTTMLRGAPLDDLVLWGLTAYGVTCTALAVLGARRRMSRAA